MLGSITNWVERFNIVISRSVQSQWSVEVDSRSCLLQFLVAVVTLLNYKVEIVIIGFMRFISVLIKHHMFK